MATCRRSVEGWAKDQGWDYRFRGDDLFDLVPNDIRQAFSAQRPLLADIARLKWAREVFDQDPRAERVIWLDADVLLFAPQDVVLPDADFAVGRQVWIQPDTKDKLRVYRQVHNAVLAIKRTTPTLDFLIQTATDLATRHDGPASPQLLGPKLLTALHNIVGFGVIEGVGMASPRVLADISAGGGPAYDLLRQDSAGPIGALNLCASYREQTVDGVACTDTLFASVIKAL